ncbi:MAG: hypothetical protein QM504_11200 [Pseudomonadota bacterium]
MSQKHILDKNQGHSLITRDSVITQHLPDDYDRHIKIYTDAVFISTEERKRRSVKFLPKQCYRELFRKSMSNDDMRIAICHLDKLKKI